MTNAQPTTSKNIFGCQNRTLNTQIYVRHFWENTFKHVSALQTQQI